MKKHLALLLSLMTSAILMTFLAVPVSASSGGYTLTVNSIKANAGDTVTVNVVASNPVAVNTIKLDLDYDSALTLTSITQGAALSGGSFMPNTADGVAVWYTTADVMASGTLFTYTFTVPAGAADGTVYDLKIASTDITNDNFDTIVPAYSDGSISVGSGATTTTTKTSGTTTTTSSGQGGFTLDVDDVKANAGDTVTVNVIASDADVFNTIKLDLDYDSALTLTSITQGAALSGGSFMPNTADGVSVWYTTADVTANGTLFTYTFTVPAGAADGTVYDLKIASTDITNDNFDTIVPAYSDGSITVGAVTTTTSSTTSDTTTSTTTSSTTTTTSGQSGFTLDVDDVKANAGDTVTVNVVASDADVFNTIKLDLDYDSALTLTSITQGAALSGGSFMPNTADGVSVWYTTADVKANGTLFTYTFTVPANAADGTVYDLKIVFTDITNDNFDTIVPAYSDGSITVGAVTTTTSSTTSDTTTSTTTSSTTSGTTTSTTTSSTTTTTSGQSGFTLDVDDVKANAGDTVTVNVVASDADVFNTIKLDLDYDSALTLTSITQGAALSGGSFMPNTADGVSVWYTTADVKANGTLFTYTFTVPANAADGTVYDLKIVFTDITNDNFDTIVPAYSDGSITVGAVTTTTSSTTSDTTTSTTTSSTTSDTTTSTTTSSTTSGTTTSTTTSSTTTTTSGQSGFTLDVDDVKANAGDTVTVNVVASDADVFNTIKFDLDYDSTLTLTSITQGAALSGGSFMPNTADGVAVWYTTADVKANGTLFTYTFEVPAGAADGTVYDLKIVFTDITNDNFDTIVPAYSDGSITVGAVTTTTSSTTSDTTTSTTTSSTTSDTTTSTTTSSTTSDTTTSTTTSSTTSDTTTSTTTSSTTSGTTTSTTTGMAAIISVNPVVANVKDTITVDVNIADNPGFGNLYLELYFDEDVYQYVGVTAGSILDGTGAVVDYTNYNSQDGRTRVILSVDSANNITANGTLLSLQLYVYDGSPDAILTDVEVSTFTSVNDELLPYTEVDAQMTVNFDFMLGDVNEDGRVTPVDALLVLQYKNESIDLRYTQQCAATVTTPGSISAYDALQILYYSAEKIDKFPIETIKP